MKKKAFSLIELSVVVIIIALIIVAITQSSRLVSQMRLTTARKLTNNSAIPALNNIIAWYDATSIEAFDVNQTNHTDKISKWIDSEIRVHERIVLEQVTSNNQPIYQANYINGLPSIYFDGNDYLEGNEKPKSMIEKNQDVNLDKKRKVKEVVYVKKWMRTRHAIMFRLSNKVVQVNF
jgi:prepilin-type N-terminal cleavage/methylation domain-containing protein